MKYHKAFALVEMLLGMIVIFALFMYSLPTLKNMSQKPVDGKPSVEQQVDKQIQDISKMRQQAEEQNRKMLQEVNY